MKKIMLGIIISVVALIFIIFVLDIINPVLTSEDLAEEIKTSFQERNPEISITKVHVEHVEDNKYAGSMETKDSKAGVVWYRLDITYADGEGWTAQVVDSLRK